MKINLTRARILFGVFGWLLLSCSALAQRVVLDYEPKKGDLTVYDLQVHANARDEAGLTLVTHITSTVEIKVADIKRDPAIPIGQDNVVEAVIEISQKDGSVKFISDKEAKTVPLQDTSTRIVADKNGRVKSATKTFEKTILDSIAAVCAELSTTKEPTVGSKWTVPVKVNLMGEAADCTVTYILTGERNVLGVPCILISSTGKLSHAFKKGKAVKKIDMTWDGKAYYAYEKGRFEHVVVQAGAHGILTDGTKATVSEFTFLMTPRKKEANPKAFAAFSGPREELPWDAVEPVPFAPLSPTPTAASADGAKPAAAARQPLHLPDDGDVGGWLKAKVTEIKGAARSRPFYHFELWLEPPAAMKQRLVGVAYDFNTPAIRPQSQASSNRASGFRISAGGLACADEIEMTLRFDDGSVHKVAVDGCKLLS